MTREEFGGAYESYLEHVHPEDRQFVKATVEAALRDRRAFSLDHRIVRGDGTLRILHARAEIIVGDTGAPVRVIGTAQDITERRRVEDALYESEERFRSAFEHSGIGMAMQALAGGYLRVNRALCDMLGYSEDELLATTYEITPPDQDAGPDRKKDRMMLAGELWSYECERRYVHKLGHEVSALVSVSLIRDSADRPTSFLLQFQDITQRRVLEQQLRQAHKMEAIGRLAGGVAHDFNNMLTIIVGRSEILLASVRPKDPLHRNIQLIRATAERASRLTQQLLAFSRQQILQPAVLDLNAVILGLREMLARLLGEDIELITRLRSPLKAVRADLGQVEQVLMNLVANARGAMPRGGQLTIETAVVELDAAFAEEHVGAVPGPHVMFAVSDTGVGMDRETQTQLFEPFFTTKELGQGTGLGLATVYGIVKQHAGYIEVESEPGRGSTFRIYLPQVDEPVTPLPAAPPTARPNGGSETLLLVEDDDVLRELGREILAAEGYTVFEARTPDEAVLVASRHPEPLDLLVTDVVMPQMSGRDLADRLAHSRSGMQVLYMSGYTDDTISHHGVLDPGVPFLPKPFTPETLLRKVRDVLDASEDE